MVSLQKKTHIPWKNWPGVYVRPATKLRVVDVVLALCAGSFFQLVERIH